MSKIVCFLLGSFIVGFNSYAQTNYKSTLLKINEDRASLKKSYDKKEIDLDSIRQYFNNALVNEIIPFWYGTQWSFEGHTATPNKGEIACGYFVSTTLRDVGFSLNRYKLAQQSPFDEAKLISNGEKIQTITNIDIQEKLFKIIEEGIYFIGLNENHVGYLLNENNCFYLIHSNYSGEQKVVKESIDESEVFKSYSIFHLVSISNNDDLIKKWLSGVSVF